MQMKPVTSRMLKAIGYDKDTKTLRVEYLKGGEYDHHGVSEEQYAELMAAESQGKHFLAHIKNQHPGTKLAPEPQAVAQ